MIPLTKILAESDYAELAPEVEIVRRYADVGIRQFPQRRWEYAMALRALSVMPKAPLFALDVGGFGSPLATILQQERSMLPTVVDPRARTGSAHNWHQASPAVFCISVIEHVPDLEEFLDDLARLTVPGGLCFLTFDIWDGGTEDKAHFHWMRQRIFTPPTWLALADGMQQRGFGLLGDADWDFHGVDPMLGYTFGSLALLKGGGA